MPNSDCENEIIQSYFSRSNSVLSNYDPSSGDKKYRKTFTTRRSIQDDNGYDTDLEEDNQRRSSIMEGTKCQKQYMKACRKLKIEPMTFAFAGLDKSTLTIGNRYPNEKENLAVAVGIAVNLTLFEVRLTNNRMSVKSLLYMCAAVWENTNITFLEISGNKLCDHSLTILVDLVKHSRHLSALILSDNGLRDMQGQLVSKLITENNSVLHLGLSYNELGDIAAGHLGEALKSDEVLRELDLSWNCIRTRGAQALCEGLKTNIRLRILNLRMNGIGTDGAGYFSRMLMNNEVLQEVDLSQNRIFDTGYGYLAKMILKNENLSRLAIGNNPVSTVGVKVFLQALVNSNNTSLTKVELEGVYISKEMEDLVETLKNMNPNMQLEVHGVVNKDTEAPVKNVSKTDGVVTMHPLEILRFYIEKTGSRLIDVFRMFDRQHQNEVTKEDFIKGLEIMQIPLTAAQVDDLMSILDSTKSGSINFGDLMEGDKEARARLRERKRRLRKQSMIPKETFDDLT